MSRKSRQLQRTRLASSGGWGNGLAKSKPASGQSPTVNPFMLPKNAGLNVISKTFPSNYYVEWDLSTWRSACDQAIKMGYTMSYATLCSWAFECSPFIQSLFTKISNKLKKISFSVQDAKGNTIDVLTDELCNQLWNLELRKEMAWSYFWGFSGLNFDPIAGKVYKYPMQDIDPINRMLRSSTYAFYDGVNFADNINLIFVQPSTSYESFLGWMQPITRSFIQMNLTSNNWVSAGRRLAFPLTTVGYPQNDNAVDATGQPFNPYKQQAEDIAANIDPSQGLVYPYTIDDKGNIVKAIDVGFENPGTGTNAHKIYQEFNQEQKNDIMTMVLGGTLTQGTAANGNRALGEVHADELDDVIDSMVTFLTAELNGPFKNKICKFYKNFPDCKFAADTKKQMSIQEIGQLSTVVIQNGKRLTDDFFISNGLNREYFEDAPAPAPLKGGEEEDEDADVMMAVQQRTAKPGSKKKF